MEEVNLLDADSEDEIDSGWCQKGAGGRRMMVVRWEVDLLDLGSEDGIGSGGWVPGGRRIARRIWQRAGFDRAK